MIDFDATVLAASMTAFARPVTVTPVVSIPGAPAYAAQGVYRLKDAQIQLADGAWQSTNEPHLGIRLADFVVPPKQNDLVAFDVGTFVIFDIVLDGQGGADLNLRSSP